MPSDDRAAHRAVLEHLGVPDAPPLGEGTEAVVYDAGDGTVVKLY